MATCFDGDNLIGEPRESRLKGASREARQLDYLALMCTTILES